MAIGIYAISIVWGTAPSLRLLEWFPANHRRGCFDHDGTP
jgi:hypothetical protein